MNKEEVKKELKKMYPELSGFIEHTMVAEICLRYHRSKSDHIVEANKKVDQAMNPIENDHPVERTLCCFKTKKGSFYLGCIDEVGAKTMAIGYDSFICNNVEEIESYQYIKNDRGGLIFIE